MKSILINKKLSITFIFVIVFLFFNFFVFEMVGAQGVGDFSGEKEQIEMDLCPDGSEASAVGCLDTKVQELNRLGSGTTVSVLIGRVIKTVMGVVGSIALIMFVYGGLVWMTGSTTVVGGANKQDVMKAKSILVWSALGIIVILSSYILVDFVFQIF